MMMPDESYHARKEYFNNHAENWCEMWYRDKSTGRYDKHEKDFARLFSLLPLWVGAHVLDAGCGTGVLVPFIIDRISSTGILYELDYAEKMIKTNHRLHKQNNIRFLIADAENVPLSAASCDVIICFSCFPHFQDKEKALAEFSRILKPGGFFVLSHFASAAGINKHHASCHAVKHDHLPAKNVMRSLFRKAALTIETFIDEPGFYFIRAMK